MASPIAAMRQRKASLALRVDFESEFPETVVFHHAHRISVAITQRNGCNSAPPYIFSAMRNHLQ